MNINKVSLGKWVAPFVLFGAGLFSLVLIVRADTANTTVVVGNSAPAISVDFNSGATITLNEGTFKYATATLTITDANGCATINYASAVAYVASSSIPAVKSCDNNDNNCYNMGSSTPSYPANVGPLGACLAQTSGGGACTGGADTSITYDCGFKLWYIAHGTDATAPVWASSIWGVSATTSDGIATTTASNDGQTVEINALNALSVSSSISYGTLGAGADTGATNSTTTATTTGNTAIDSNVSGTDMSSGGNTLAVGQQCYLAAPFTWASTCTGSVALTTGATALELSNAYPTSTTSPPSSDTSWGIGIPTGQANGTYTGVNTIDAIAD